MRKQKIYIDISVIGGCFDIEFEEWSNRLIEDFKSGKFIPVISDLVLAEIENAPKEVIDKSSEIINCSAIILRTNNDVIELANEYKHRQILSPNYYDDGLHIALATIEKVDLLVSWNFKHIVHFEKIRMFNAVNLELGYKPIEIYSPMEVASNE